MIAELAKLNDRSSNTASLSGLGAAVSSEAIEELNSRVDALREMIVVNEQDLLTSINERTSTLREEVISEVLGAYEPVIVDLGGTGCPRLTLPNCKWKSGEFDINISNDPIMDSAPFTSHPSNASECSNVVSATPAP